MAKNWQKTQQQIAVNSHNTQVLSNGNKTAKTQQQMAVNSLITQVLSPYGHFLT